MMEEISGGETSEVESGVDHPEVGEVDGNVESVEEATPQGVEYHTLKINGQEKKMTLEDVYREAQKSIAATEKFQEASREKQIAQTKLADMDKTLEYIRNNPIEAMGHLGLDFNELAEQHVLKQAEYDMMDEGERKYHDLQKEMERKEAELKRYQASQEQIDHTNRVESYKQQISTGLKEVGLSDSPQYQAEVARELDVMIEYRNPQLPPPTVKDAVIAVKNRMSNMASSSVKDLPVEKLIEMFGEDKLKQIREFELAKLRTNDGQNLRSKGNVTPIQKKSPKMSKDEWKQWLHSQY